MKATIKYDVFNESDFEALFKMGRELWKDYQETYLKKQLERVIGANNQRIYIAKNSKGIAVGFAIFTIRTDYVEGSEKAPTGYLEGIYIEPDFRNNGISKRFLEMGEQWLKSNNCMQLGSDTWLSNTNARAFHKQFGFKEEIELVHFLKELN